MLKHLVFDFGGVILDLDGVHTGYPDVLARIFGISVAQAQALWNDNKTGVIVGHESSRAFLERMKVEQGFSLDTDKGLETWRQENAISRDRIDWELLGLIDGLRPRFRVHMLTDQIQLDNGAGEWISEVNQRFDTILRSYEQGFRKPFPEAYANLLVKIGAENEPESVVFFDDAKVNVDAAIEAGIQGVLYRFREHELVRAVVG